MLTTINADKNTGQQKLLFILIGMQNDSHWKTVWQFLRKLNILLPHDPAIVLLSIYIKLVENMSTQKSSHVGLFIIFKTWKQPRYPSVVVYSDNGILFSTKRNELSSHEKTWRNLKWILLSKKTILRGHILYDSNDMTYGKGKTMEIVKRSVVVRGWRDSGINRQNTEDF